MLFPAVLCLVIFTSLPVSSLTNNVDDVFNDYAPSDVIDSELELMQRENAELESETGRSIEERGARPSGCPVGFSYLASVNGCYKVVLERMEWSVAGINCKSIHKDAHLVIVNNAQEQRAIVTNLINWYSATTLKRCSKEYKDGRMFWTAGQRVDPSSQSTFVWKIVSVDDYPRAEVSLMKYTNWFDPQPNYTGSKESCMHLYGSGGRGYAWNDHQCRLHFCSICEIDL